MCFIDIDRYGFKKSIDMPSIFPSIISFLMSQLFETGGQSIGASASASVLSMNILD